MTSQTRINLVNLTSFMPIYSVEVSNQDVVGIISHKENFTICWTYPN